MALHVMMALDPPLKMIIALNKIVRGFLRHGHAEAKGGNYGVAWSEVCKPKRVVGLRVSDLRWMNIVMQMRWTWLKRA